MDRCEISKATLGRIPMYINYIESLSEDVKNISASKIAKELGLGEVQVRKDLSSVCKNGKPKIGYDLVELKNCLKDVLSFDGGGAIVVGAGKLGKALLEYGGFETYGTKILAGFDNSIDEPIKLNSGKYILPVEKMKEFCKDNDVKVGIITTPAQSAQSVLNKLYECNIKLIWCFAPCRLYKPVDVEIQYENLALSLAHLKWQSNKKEV